MAIPARPDTESQRCQTAMNCIRANWVSLVLAAFALVLALAPWPFASPIRVADAVPGWATDPTPVRQPGLKPRYVAAGFEYRCSDCHMILPAPAEASARLTQHTEIVLEHGINTRCFNCHHPTQRDFFVDDFGNADPVGSAPIALREVSRAGLPRLATRSPRPRQRALGHRAGPPDPAPLHSLP